MLNPEFGQTLWDVLSSIFTGQNLAVLGAAIAMIFPGMGSAKAVGFCGESLAGVMADDPKKFGRLLACQALPATQGLYGFVIAFLISGRITADLTLVQGASLLIASLPITIVGYFSAIKQGKVSVAGMALLSKRPNQLGKVMTTVGMVELYAILSLLISIFLLGV